MRQSSTGLAAFGEVWPPTVFTRRRVLWGWLVVAALGLPAAARGQEPPATGPAAAAAKTKGSAAESPGEIVPLGKYVASEKLAVYLEFAGLDAHADAWKKTAAAKMLDDTPLGSMLEEVANQLLDRFMGIFPNRRVSGPELVKLVKHAFHSGFVIAIRGGKEGPTAFRATIVLRNAGNKEMRSISARVMGWMMGAEAKPKIEHKEGRTLVSVPIATPGTPQAQGWSWWSERNDLVMCAPFPVAVDETLAALDGKIPSVLDHPTARELYKPEGTFVPVGIALLETALPSTPAAGGAGGAQGALDPSAAGIKRIDFRFGFDDDALMTVARVVAPKPRQMPAAVFDQPTFDKNTLLPLPEGVDSFVQVSMNPAQIMEVLNSLAPGGGFKEQFDELSSAIRATGKVDVEKDLLGGFGPKMAIYLAPGRSAVTTSDESPENLFGHGLSSLTSFSAIQAMFPKVTMIAEVKDPVNFAKALDTAITAINGEFKARAIEVATEAEAAKGAPADDGRTAASKAAAAAAERARKRRIRETPHPMFKAAPDRKNTYFLHTPHDSVIRFGTSSLGPTVQLDGNYLAISVAPDAVRGAIDALKSKNSKPSSKSAKALEHTPDKLVALAVEDVPESLPTFLASLPGTLQSLINTSIALTAGGAPAGGTPAPPAGAPSPMAGPGGGNGPRGLTRPGGRGARVAADGESPRGGGGTGGPGGPMAAGGPMRPGGPGPGGGGAPAAPAMFQFNIDAAKLPKAEDLKALMFANTLAITVSDQEIKFVARGAFPSMNLPMLMGPISLLTPSVKAIADSAAKSAAAAAPAGDQAAGGGPPGGQRMVPPGPAGFSGPGVPGNPRGPGGPGNPRGPGAAGSAPGGRGAGSPGPN